MVAGLSERHRHEEGPVRPQDPTKLAQRSCPAAFVALAPDAVHRVVGTHVLQRRDEQHLVERAVRERQLPHVGLDGLHTLHLRGCQIDAHELDARAKESREICPLREGVPHLEHAARVQAREDPRDLDHPLVRARRLQPAEPLSACARPQAESDGIVELANAPVLVAGGELVDQRCPRKRAVGQLCDRAVARLGIGLAAEHEPVHRVDELDVGAVASGELGREPGIHHA